jgi:hypothetical protein
MSFLTHTNSVRLFEHEISQFFPLMEDPVSRSGSGADDPIESGFNPAPDPKHWYYNQNSTLNP